MHMRVGALVLGLLVLVSPSAARAQHGEGGGHDGAHPAPPASGLRAELIADVEQLEGKYTGLARAMTGKFGWRPAEGVRSVGEVFAHVAGANFMIPGMAGVAMPASLGSMENARAHLRQLETAGTEAEIIQALEHSFAHAKHALAQVTDAQLDEATRMFGREATKRQVLTLLVTHMHEHLGQSIAYARSNGVTPPWSGGN